MLQDAAGKVQGAAKTQYETAKDTASNLADKAQGHAKDAHGQAKVRSPLHPEATCHAALPCSLRMAWTTCRSPLHISNTLLEECCSICC